MSNVINRDDLFLLLNPVLFISHIPVELPQLTAVFEALSVMINKNMLLTYICNQKKCQRTNKLLRFSKSFCIKVKKKHFQKLIKTTKVNWNYKITKIYWKRLHLLTIRAHLLS